MYELVSAYKYGNKIIPIKMTVKNFKTKEDTLYCVTTFEKIKEADIITATAAVKDSLYTVQSTSTIKLADLLKNVNKNSDLGKYIPSQFYEDGKKQSGSGGMYSLKVNTDSAGNTLTEQQQEYFKDSKVRDDKGALMVVYHQTDADFTEFRFRQNKRS